MDPLDDDDEEELVAEEEILLGGDDMGGGGRVGERTTNLSKVFINLNVGTGRQI
tara:strand:- start:126 stop:287 length:162 start_codon:yes stop_codon:yes gene_type:complete